MDGGFRSSFSGSIPWRPPGFPVPSSSSRGGGGGGEDLGRGRGGDGDGDGDGGAKRAELRFPVKVACTAGVLSLLGDTIAQLRSHSRTRCRSQSEQSSGDRSIKVIAKDIIDNYDWLRALRMSTYGFFIYGPSSHIWYIFLDKMLKEKTLTNLSVKVALNQLVLGPYVIAVVFAWNSLWQGKLDKLPAMYSDHAVSTLVNGWKFWIPASVLNFGVVPLQARVAFMSSCSIFWNFYLSTTMGKS